MALPIIGSSYLVADAANRGTPVVLLEYAKRFAFNNFECNALGGNDIMVVCGGANKEDGEADIRYMLKDNFENYPKNSSPESGTPSFQTIFGEVQTRTVQYGEGFDGCVGAVCRG